MLYSLLRGLKVRQVGQISLNLSVNGTAVTPVASGPDSAFIQSVVKNATGDITITLKESAKSNLHISSLVLATADSSIIVFAVNKNAVQIKAKSIAASPIAKDVDFSIQIQYFDQLTYFF